MSDIKELKQEQLKNISGGSDKEKQENNNPKQTGIWFKPLDDKATNPICGSGIGGKDVYKAGPQIFTEGINPEDTETKDDYANPWK